jgi:hypothetical protein
VLTYIRDQQQWRLSSKLDVSNSSKIPKRMVVCKHLQVPWNPAKSRKQHLENSPKSPSAGLTNVCSRQVDRAYRLYLCNVFSQLQEGFSIVPNWNVRVKFFYAQPPVDTGRPIQVVRRRFLQLFLGSHRKSSMSRSRALHAPIAVATCYINPRGRRDRRLESNEAAKESIDSIH